MPFFDVRLLLCIALLSVPFMLPMRSVVEFMVPVPEVPLFIVPLGMVLVLPVWGVVGVVWAKAALVERANAAARIRETFMEKEIKV